MSECEVIRDFELSLFCGCCGLAATTDSRVEPLESDAVCELMRLVASSDWTRVLADDQCSRLVGHALDKRSFAFVHASGSGDYREDFRLLLVAVGSLLAFEQLNYTGPCAVADASFGVGKVVGDASVEQLNELARQYLGVDGEAVYEKTLSPFLLALSESILLSGCKLSVGVVEADEANRVEAAEQLTASNAITDSCLTWLLWTLRALTVHQHILDEKCQTIKNKVVGILNAVDENAGLQPLLDPCSQLDVVHSVAAQFYLEAFRVCSLYYMHDGIERNLAKANESTGLSIHFKGVRGKRTRYQEKDVPQLHIDVDLRQPSELSPANCCTPTPASCLVLPRNVALNDDTLLENVTVSAGEHWDVADLTVDQQATVLAACEHNMVVKAEAADIVNEETLAYLSYLLRKPRNWCVQASALMLRSLTEADKSRRAERSLHQLETLVSLCQDKDPPVAVRLSHLGSTGYLPTWKVEQRLADYQAKIGAFGSALEIYERLGFWEEVVNCCHRIGRRQKAESIVREQLKRSESPLLYCCLADATDNLEYYHKAWEMSNYKFARAARGLGFAHLRRGEYTDAVKFFELGLEINALHLGAWFSCGCAAMAAGEYQKAARCFQRCVSIDSDNFEAWNNMAAAYVRSQQKPRALAVLEDALKCNFENWRVWENYLVVATDCGAFDAVIRAAHRLLDLKEKWSDPQVISILCRAVLENRTDMFGKPAQTHKSDLLQLLGRLTAKVTPDGDTWCMYARLLLSGEERNTTENVDRALQYLSKAYRCLAMNSDWEKDVTKCKTVACQIVELSAAYMDAYEIQCKPPLLSSVKLQLKSIATRIKQRHTDPITGNLNVDLQEPVRAVEAALAAVLAKIDAPPQG